MTLKFSVIKLLSLKDTKEETMNSNEHPLQPKV